MAPGRVSPRGPIAARVDLGAVMVASAGGHRRGVTPLAVQAGALVLVVMVDRRRRAKSGRIPARSAAVSG